jgi:hypothetical protein
MPIRDAKAYVASLWNWKCLLGCFGPKILPTDIDGFVERGGHFLFLETKLPKVPVPIGQGLAFDRLVELPPITLIYIWGRPEVPEKLRYIDGRLDRVYDPADLHMLRAFCCRWWAKADAAARREWR